MTHNQKNRLAFVICVAIIALLIGYMFTHIDSLDGAKLGRLPRNDDSLQVATNGLSNCLKTAQIPEIDTVYIHDTIRIRTTWTARFKWDHDGNFNYDTICTLKYY